MSKKKASGSTEDPGSPVAEAEPQRKAGISASLGKLQQAGAKLYTEMSGSALPAETLGALREIVREIGETRLESEVLEHDCHASQDTLRALESAYFGTDGVTFSADELDRLKALPNALEKAIEEQEAFAREMDRL